MDRPLSSYRRDERRDFTSDRHGSHYNSYRGRRNYSDNRRGSHSRGGGNQRRESGNRFQAEQQDPKQTALRKLQQLLSKVGDLELPPNMTEEQNKTQRPVVTAQTQKIQALTTFLSSPQADIFHNDNSLVSSLIHCQAVRPLQTPCYAALTLVAVPSSSSSCVEYAVHFLARDLDDLLLATTTNNNNSHRAVVRLRLTLRYLVLLAKIGIVAVTNETSAVLAATHQRPVGVLGLLEAMVQAAVQATSERYHANQHVAYLLMHLVWDTIPYIRDMVSLNWISENLVEPLQEIMQVYQSTFAPGVGSTSILLKAERYEDVGEDDDEDEDDDDEEEEEDSGAAVCDSFQDLLRTIKHWLSDDSVTPRFALFSDAPWQDMTAPTAEKDAPPAGPLVFTGEPKSLQIFPICRVLTMLLGGDVAPETKLAKIISLDAIVVGRLPIFGPPLEEEEEEMEDDAPVNERLQCYRKHFGIVDRFFLSQAARDCLLCHESTVTDAGVEHGSPKAVAEELWSLRYTLLGENAMGIEYCILEVIFSLITQADRGSHFRVMYLSRVLLELTRLEPTIFSPAIALGVSILFEDYMPALVPVAGYNLSKWFAFHLTNTDYQWPSAYWKHWEPFVLYGWSNSRGAFVKGALTLMMENVSNPDLIVTDCLPKGSSIASHLVPPLPDRGDESLASLIDEMTARIWKGSIDSDMLLNHFLSEEFSKSVASLADSKWGKVKVLFGALLSPAKASWKVTKNQIDRAIARDESQVDMDESEDDSDPLSSVLEMMDKLKRAILSVLEKEVAEHSSVGESDSTELRDLLILELIMDATLYSRSLMEGFVLHCLRLRFVSAASILKWCLGESSDGSTRPQILRWWQMAGMILNTGISLLLTEILSSASDAMSDDNTEQNDKQRLVGSGILGYLDPLLSHMIQRVCRLLHSSKIEKSSKLSPDQIDLAEGFKYVAIECHACYFSHVAKVGGTSAKQCNASALQDALMESPVSGQALAMLMDASGSLAAEHLRQSLERM